MQLSEFVVRSFYKNVRFEFLVGATRTTCIKGSDKGTENIHSSFTWMNFRRLKSHFFTPFRVDSTLPLRYGLPTSDTGTENIHHLHNNG